MKTRSFTLLVVAVGAWVTIQAVSNAFVQSTPQQRALSSLRVALRAEDGEGVVTKMPKPDMSLLGQASKQGQTYDQDKRGNVWPVPARGRRKTEDEAFPGYIAVPLIIVATFAFMWFWSNQATDEVFGGMEGDFNQREGI
eukprot:TRINITY_DN1230_c0_g1_i4.p1 TRINITY_DN1230_c0_g1~~TRINITY_DN1230_c0_g1_i4.p1  ORF type:complete len:140 (-),score=25.61 TRINITY_DN1230_c0_g1_i4:375-794(-)